MATTRGEGHVAAMEPAHGHRDPSSQLRHQVGNSAVKSHDGLDFQRAQYTDLHLRVRGVAKPLDDLQVNIVWLPPRTLQATGPQKLGRHGAG